VSLANSLEISREPRPDINRTLAGELFRASNHQLSPSKCSVAYANNRRLRSFYERVDVPGMLRATGLQDEVLRDEGYLWMGPIRGAFHFDEEPNIYVQLSGASDVFLIPPSHVDIYTRGARFRDLPSREELLRDPVLKTVPIILFRMRPGDAVTFPGRTFHLFVAQTQDRLAVNFFFLPRWRRLECSADDWYSREAREPRGLERLALRQLWARSFVRLYEETGRGIIFMGEKNEYI